MNPSLLDAPRVLVTGGCGFIGSWVIRELLARRVGVVVFDVAENRSRWRRIMGPASDLVPVHSGQLTDRGALERAFSAAPVSHVIHLAALLTPECQTDPVRGCEVNVLGTTLVFETARAHGVAGLAWASSLAVFGPEPGESASAPGQAVNTPPSFYGAFKRASELIARQYWMHFQFPSVGIRPHVVYGPERELGISAGPSLAARAAARGETYTFSFRGRLGYDYVTDVARAFVRGALESPPGAHLVDLPSESADVGQIIALLTEIVPEAAGRLSIDGPALPANDSPRHLLISDLFPDWRPTPLREGLRQTVEYYRT